MRRIVLIVALATASACASTPTRREGRDPLFDERPLVLPGPTERALAATWDGSDVRGADAIPRVRRALARGE